LAKDKAATKQERRTARRMKLRAKPRTEAAR
jgi:hypothetical protein